jgi:sugar phosphate isomerase/epimerase
VTVADEAPALQPEMVFWPGSAYVRSFEEQLVVAQAGGFTSFALTPECYRATTGRGISARDMKSMAEDCGVPIGHIDTVTGWAPVRVPPGASDVVRARFDIPLDDILSMADLFDTRTMLAVAGFEAGSIETERLCEAFAELCDEASARGMWIDLEFMPFLGIPDIGAAWAIVEGAGRPNAGIMLDTWHFFAGRPDFEVLDRIPGGRIRSIQLADFALPLRGADLFEEAIRYRRIPGEGTLPLARLIAMVAAKGQFRSVGPEIFSDDCDCLASAELGRRLGRAVRDVLAEAAGSPDDGHGPRLIEHTGHDRMTDPTRYLDWRE